MDNPEPTIVESVIDRLEEDDVSVQSEEGDPFENQEFFENDDEEYASLCM